MHNKTAFTIHISTVMQSKTPFPLHETSVMYNKTQFPFRLSARFPACRRFGILASTMLRQAFTDFIFATNTDGSGKAAFCVRALDMQGVRP